jgi:hypothetical protein
MKSYRFQPVVRLATGMTVRDAAAPDPATEGSTTMMPPRARTLGAVIVAGTAKFSIGFTRPWLRHRAGHRYLVTLARNNDRVYTTRPAALGVVVS